MPWHRFIIMQRVQPISFRQVVVRQCIYSSDFVQSSVKMRLLSTMNMHYFILTVALVLPQFSALSIMDEGSQNTSSYVSLSVFLNRLDQYLLQNHANLSIVSTVGVVSSCYDSIQSKVVQDEEILSASICLNISKLVIAHEAARVSSSTSIPLKSTAEDTNYIRIFSPLGSGNIRDRGSAYEYHDYL